MLIIKESTAKMPQSCWGRYVIVAVLDCDEWTTLPKMISRRAKGVREVLWSSGPVHLGGSRSAAAKAHQCAAELVAARQAVL